jgi:pimeloyl-ACP methyl ester carboxylesterase
MHRLAWSACSSRRRLSERHRALTASTVGSVRRRRCPLRRPRPGRSVVVGHSAGAAVAVELAVRRAELVAAMVALDNTLGFPAVVLE